MKLKSFCYAFEALVASNEFIFEQIQSKEPNPKAPTSKSLNPLKNPEISSIPPVPSSLPISKIEKTSHDEFQPRTQNGLRSKEVSNR